MRSGLRMKRPMGECGADAFPLIEESARLFIEVSGYKMIPYVIFRFFSRMDHIAFVETVVAQVIHHDLEGGIIFYIRMRLHDGTTGRAQYGLAETVPFDCVAERTHGTNGKDYCARRIEGPQPVVESGERFHDVIAAKKGFRKMLRGHLVTIGDNRGRFPACVDPRCAVRENERTCSLEEMMRCSQAVGNTSSQRRTGGRRER